MSVREENLNVMLAELLAERGLRALGEVVLRKGGRRPEPDILIELNGVRIVIEGRKLEQKQNTWKALAERCDERLDSGICDLCVMVEYVDIPLRKLNPSQLDIKEALLNGKFNVGFISYVDKVGLEKWLNVSPKPEKYEAISFNELLTHLMSAYSKIVREDIIDPVIKKINEILNEFAKVVSTQVNVERLKDVLELREKEEEPDER
jgi:hypothetical protein